MTPEITSAEAGMIERLLAPPHGGALLDVPCGPGRHAIELARRGYRLTGVDASPESLALARAEDPNIDWREADMLDLPWTAAFDGAHCFGNSFGYLDKPGVRAFLAALRRALEPGGRMAIETAMAAESILPNLPHRLWHSAGGIYMLSEARYVAEASRLDTDYTFVHDGVVETRPSSSYVLRVAEIRELVEEAGFEEIRLLGAGGAEPFKFGAFPLIVAARATA